MALTGGNVLQNGHQALVTTPAFACQARGLSCLYAFRAYFCEPTRS